MRKRGKGEKRRALPSYAVVALDWFPSAFLPFLMPVPEGNRCPGDEVGLRWPGQRGLGHYLECLFCLKMADKEQRQMIKFSKVKIFAHGRDTSRDKLEKREHKVQHEATM